MTISSRTPEGTPNRCGLCGHRVHLEPAILSFDAPCPFCGHLLWFARPAGKRFKRAKVRQTWAYAAGALVRQLLNLFTPKWSSV